MKKILIVEDMEVSRYITESMLEERYQTFCASHAEEAQEIYRKEKPDAIVCDFTLPDMTGYNLQNALQNEFHKKIPFLFMTVEDKFLESAADEDNIIDFIHKPFNSKVLLFRIANLLRIDRQEGYR